MPLPEIEGIIKRRLLINYRVDPEVARRFLPAPFRPKLHQGHAIAGICLIRLEKIRPKGFPSLMGPSSENAAHRFSVEWDDATGKTHEGVFIPRRDTGSILNHLSGGRLFPGEHHRADFKVVDNGMEVDFRMDSRDGTMSVSLRGTTAEGLPSQSCFASLDESSRFFENGSMGYSVRHTASGYDGLRLCTQSWKVEPLQISEVASTFFADQAQFPAGSVVFDHALIMRDLPHSWVMLPEPAEVGNMPNKRRVRAHSPSLTAQH